MNNLISEKKLFMMLSIELFALTSLILPAVLVGFAGKNGIPVLLAASGVLLLLAVWYLTCYKTRQMSLDQVVNEKPGMISVPLKIVYVVRFFLHGLFLMIIFVNLIQEVLLPEYNFFWILFPVLLLVYLMAGKQLRVRGRILEVLFPYIFVPLFVVLFLALFQLDYKALPQQLWGTLGQGTEKSMLYGVYGILLFYQPIEFILFLLPALQDGRADGKKKHPSRVVGAACIFVILINVIMYVSAIGMFGTVRTGEKLWSALYIMQSVRLPGKFVERLDILFLVFWIFSAFALFSAYMYYGGRFLVSENAAKEISQQGSDPGNNLSNRKKSNWYTLIWLLGIYAGVLVIRQPEKMFEFFIPYKMWIDFPLSLFLPALVYNRKKNRKKGLTAALLVMMCCFVMTGCQDRADIEDRNYVMTIGIEKGETKSFRIMYEIADLSQSAENGGSRKGKIISYEADSLKEAAQLDRRRDDKKLDYGHLKAILFEKSLMEKEEIGKVILKELEESNSIAGTTLLFFTEEELQKMMETGEKNASSFGEYMDRMMANQKTGVAKEDTLSKLLRDMSEKVGERKICVLKTVGEQIELEKGTLKWNIGQKEEVLSGMAENGAGTWFQLTEKSVGTTTQLADTVLRFHIRANSDTVLDQTRKTAVKDRILPRLQTLLEGADSKAECVTRIETSLESIEEWVREACKQEAYDCNVKVYLCRESFPLKAYGNIILPSGTYDALRIDLGIAQGANWWCMMYPSLCVRDGVIERVSEEGEEHLKDELEEEEYEKLFFNRKEKKFHVRWRIAEWCSKVWNKVSTK